MPKLDLDEEIEKIDNIEDKLSIAEDYASQDQQERMIGFFFMKKLIKMMNN